MRHMPHAGTAARGHVPGPIGSQNATWKVMRAGRQIDGILRSDLDHARSQAEAARAEYQKILGRLSHDQASREEIDRLEEARRGEMAAREAFWKALLRLSEFCRSGTVPLDLQELIDKASDENHNAVDCQ